MGRAKSRIRHDYKPQGDRARRPGRLHVLGLSLAAAVLGTFFLFSQDEASGTQTPVTPPVASDQAPLRSIPLPLPAAATDPSAAHADTGVAPGVDAVTSGPEAAGATAAETAAAAEPAGAALILTVRQGDSMDRLFRRHGLSVADLASILSITEAKNALKKILPGDEIQLVHDGERVLSLTRRLGEQVSLRVVRAADGFDTEFITHPVERRPSDAHGRISTSLFEAGMDAGLSQALIMKLAGIFAWDVDFALDIRAGDSFTVVYEEIWQDGKFLRDGDILAAEFVNQGRVYRALRFEDPEGRVDYYSPEGRSMRKAFLRAPVDFRRVSSNFNPNRLHPILKIRRPHRGVDYAADAGTPIVAAGDGKIVFRGRKGGYGNCVIIRHGGNVETLYGHMSKFNGKATVGSRVQQGQVIGYVGMTGLASAPHLHYEYRLNGVHRNPRTVPLPEAEPVPSKFRSSFEAAAHPLVAQLDALSSTRLARAN